jgi:hypothetical protein
VASGLEELRAFFASAPVALRATRPLSRAARVALRLEGGPARFGMETGAPRVEAGECADPDFTLEMPPGAVRRITALASDDVGEFGVAFFGLVLAKDPDLRVSVRIDAPTARLVANGYLGVLALGGLRVALWLLRKGARGPRAAIERLRGKWRG